MSARRFAVLGDAPALAEAVDWYRVVSSGQAVLRPEILPLIEPASGWAAHAQRGGHGSPPHNSQSLVESLLAALASRPSALIHGVMAVTPAGYGYAPHVWRLRGGGFWLGGRHWVRRYAIVPADATLGVLVHELGHLLFGWSDHDRRSRIGADCLMATGAGSDSPAAPCALCRIEARWIEAIPATRMMTVADLADGRVVRSRNRLIELGRGGDVLVFEGHGVVARVAAEGHRPILAVVASAAMHLSHGFR